MAHLLSHLETLTNENLLVGPKTSDDAGVYKVDQDLALVQTLDFFTPIVNDPYDYGKIAAANSLSDVYAMGGRPVTVMNIVCFPVGKLEMSILLDILRGGADKAQEAGAVIVGGHTLQDKEIKYGMSVTGYIDPNKIITNSSAKPGDVLILTKPLGTGLIISAIKAGKALDEEIDLIVESMAMLNKDASEAMVEVGVNACTDITGFGLLGHAYEMTETSHTTFCFSMGQIPIFAGCERYVKMGLMPGASLKNKKYLSEKIKVESSAQRETDIVDVLFDAQTSGGLLISVSRSKEDDLCDKLTKKGVNNARVIGEVVERGKYPLIIKE